MMVDISSPIVALRVSRPSAVRNPLVKAEPWTQNEAAAKNGFEPSFWSRGQNSFSESKSPPWVGVVRWAKRLQVQEIRGRSGRGKGGTAEHDWLVCKPATRRVSPQPRPLRL